MFTISDVTLLLKKIAIGILVAVIPFVIIFGGLWLTRKVLGSEENSGITNTTSAKP